MAMAASASLPMVNGPWFCMSTAGDFGYFFRVSTTPSPMASEPMRRNGPTGTGPPNSSPIMVRPHGMFWPVAVTTASLTKGTQYGNVG